MNTAHALSLTVLTTTAVFGETANFDGDKSGALPASWIGGVTGSGKPVWTVETDATAPSQPNVLKQSGQGDFPWCVKRGVAMSNGFVEVKFKPVSGWRDQAGGVVWRWKDGDNYYVARANALENNISLYYTEKGRRQTIKYANAPVARDCWHLLRVEFAGKAIKVSLNGVAYISLEDEHIGGSGAVGAWTKADSVTVFDDFAYGATAGR